MSKGNIILEKSYDFSLRIINTANILFANKQFDLGRQILRSGTSIGANVEEAIGGQSPKEFMSKLSIAYKEARETNYWLRLLRDSKFLDFELSNSLILESESIIKIIAKIRLTMIKRVS